MAVRRHVSGPRVNSPEPGGASGNVKLASNGPKRLDSTSWAVPAWYSSCPSATWYRTFPPLANVISPTWTAAVQIDESAVKLQAAGLALANATKHKLSGLLHQQLKEEGVYVGEIVITGTIKGSSWDNGKNPNTVEPSAVGDAYWKLQQERKEWSIKFPG